MKILSLRKEHVPSTAVILNDEYYPSLAEAKKDLNATDKEKRWLIALEGEEVVGVIGYRYDYSHYANFLEDLVVKKGWRRQGIARALVERFIEKSRREQPKRQPYCLSSTDVTNKESIAFHKKLGFIELGRIKELHFGKDEIIFGHKL